MMFPSIHIKKEWFVFTSLLLICTLLLSGCSLWPFEQGAEGHYEDIESTDSKGEVVFEDKLADEKVKVRTEDQDEDSIPNIDVTFLSDGDKVLVIATDSSGTYFPNYYETTYAKLSESSAIPLGSKFVPAPEVEPITIALFISLALYSIYNAAQDWMWLEQNPPTLINETTDYVDECWNSEQVFRYYSQLINVGAVITAPLALAGGVSSIALAPTLTKPMVITALKAFVAQIKEWKDPDDTRKFRHYKIKQEGEFAGYHAFLEYRGNCNDPPRANITSPSANSTFTEGESIKFTGNANDPDEGELSGTSLAWESNIDGLIGTGQTITTSSLSVGTHTITLTAEDNRGTEGEDSITIIVEQLPNDPPVADVSASPTSGTAPLTVDFDGTGSDDPDGSIVSYDWTFGDGSSGTGSTISHTYHSQGNYTASLTVTDDRGATDTDSVSISVEPENQPPTADFRYSPSSPQVGETIHFTDESYDPDGSIVDWQWDFDDGHSSSSQNPSHTYSGSGDYYVCLTVWDNQGADDKACTNISVGESQQDDIYNLQISEISCKEIEITADYQYYSNHGEDVYIGAGALRKANPVYGLATVPQPVNKGKGTVTVSLECSNEDCAGVTSDQLELEMHNPGGHPFFRKQFSYSKQWCYGENQPPVADFTYRYASETQYYYFYDQSYDSDGYISSRYWVFVFNGERLTLSDYTEVGLTLEQLYCSDVDVTLTVTDNDGAEDSTHKSFTTPCYGENQPPVADFSWEWVYNGPNDQYWQFTDQSYDPDGYITSWYWSIKITDYYSGSSRSFTSSQQNPRLYHQYNWEYCGSTIEASLKVTDNDGAQDTATKSFDTGDCP